MTTGKDPRTADGLGGVHNVTLPRQPVPTYPATASPGAASPGPVPGADAHMESEPDQVGKVVHTQPPPIEPSSGADARESALGAIRTPEAPFQDARISPEGPSAWAAEKPSGD